MVSDCAARVVIADHHSLCREGLATLLNQRLGVSTVAQLGDFSHCLAALARYPDVAVVSVDIDLPEMRGVIGLRRLRTDYPSVRVVVVAASRERDLVLETLCAGVHGYIIKDTPSDEFVRAFDMILAGHVYVPPLVSDLHVRPSAAAGAVSEAALTERQLDVLRLVAAGRSNKEIARTLHIAEGTVKVHITAAFRALGVHNRTSAAAAFQLRPRNDNPLASAIAGTTNSELVASQLLVAELPLWG